MRLLLDTHVVIWWLMDAPMLPVEVKSLIDDEPEVYLSPVTVWEVTIKQALGKITEPIDLAERILACGFREIPIRAHHAVAAGRLPMIHRDPFDRMLVAQANCDNLTLVTHDRDIRQYEVALLAV